MSTHVQALNRHSVNLIGAKHREIANAEQNLQTAVGYVEAYKAVATAEFEKRRATMEAELASAIDQLQSTLTASVERYSL
eukprot:SAG31_NODE_4324_length_3357_cov_2.015347_3_plen_80_part_00